MGNINLRINRFMLSVLTREVRKSLQNISKITGAYWKNHGIQYS